MRSTWEQKNNRTGNKEQGNNRTEEGKLKNVEREPKA